MNYETQAAITQICTSCNNDRTRMMDIARSVQGRFGGIDDEMIDLIARLTFTNRVEVEGVVSFYSFFSREEKGKVVIRICNDTIDMLKGAGEVTAAFEKELGINVGQTSIDKTFTLEVTPCIGMCDQAPAALINDVVVTNLTPAGVPAIVAELKKDLIPARLISECGDGNNGHRLIRAMVRNNIMEKGPVIFAPMEQGVGLRTAVAMKPEEVIKTIKDARLRGRGGAGFPAGMKWDFTRGAAGSDKVIICNADEGEPGTFKDRVILTECPHLLFEGMTIAAYAIGAGSGIVYLRGEYAYLKSWLEAALQERREKGLLGYQILGRSGFSFDIRIQMGAGAYVCGEETALISSCEGLRGDPKNRPPFPAQRGYLGRPTSVNNVETLCCAARIMEKGAAWFAGLGSEKSAGTKLISISGDCSRPGVYELPFGVSLRELLDKAGARDTIAAQVGGASGFMVPPSQFERKICFDDLATGGAVMVFKKGRDVLKILHSFMEFFVEESCGYCTPCRVGNVILRDLVARMIAGRATQRDISIIRETCATMKVASRCGLGQMSPNPVLSVLNDFKSAYEHLLKPEGDSTLPSFDLKEAVSQAEKATGRSSIHA